MLSQISPANNQISFNAISLKHFQAAKKEVNNYGHLSLRWYDTIYDDVFQHKILSKEDAADTMKLLKKYVYKQGECLYNCVLKAFDKNVK